MRRTALLGSMLSVAVWTACSGENTDGVAPDASVPDAGSITIAEAGVRPDARPVPDSGAQNADIGFADPNTLSEGPVNINIENVGRPLPTWVHTQGTLTSTLPPLIVLHTGPDVSHEYLPEHLSPLVQNRFVVYYDMRATGRTSFGTTGTSTITIDQFVIDLKSMITWVMGMMPTPKVDVLGHGFGATVAALMAARHPGLIRNLVMTTPYPIDISYLAARNGERSRRLTAADRMRLNNIMTMPECLRNLSDCYLMIWDIFGKHELCVDNQERFFDLSFRYGSPRADRFQESYLRNTSYDFRQEMATISSTVTRTTIIGGVCETTPIESTRDYAAAIPSATYHELSDSGHFPMVETATTFISLVEAGLR